MHSSRHRPLSLDPFRRTNYPGSSYFPSRNGHSDYSKETTISRRYASRNGCAILPSKPLYDYSRQPTSSSGNGTSRTGRADKKADLVRPAIRSRHTSIGRENFSSTRETTRELSLSRQRSSTREYPGYARRVSPSREPRTTVPESKTSTYDKTRTIRNGSKVSRSPSMGSSGYLNGRESPNTLVKRTNKKLDDSQSPSSVQRKTNHRTKIYDCDAGSPLKSSAGSKGYESNSINGRTIPSFSSGRDFSDTHAGLVGLKNIGNTCFMNSILQCLSNTRLLRNYCIDRKYERDINKTSSPMKGRLVEAFSEIIRQLWYPSPNCSTVSTSSFKRQIATFSKRFSGYEQQDAQEFLRFLIEGLHEDVNKVRERPKDPIPDFDSLSDERKATKTWDFYLSKDNSYIVDLFMGQLQSSLTCVECRHVSTTFDPFWDLSLPLPKDIYTHDRLDVQRCLDNFTKEEVLEDDERPTCYKCRARRRMTKKFTIYKFPRILVIHLKRFSEGRYRKKIQSNVHIPHRLEITRPVSTSQECFNLYAVSNHSGQCYGGHYTAYCKKPETDRWHSYSDSMVSSMNENCVQTKEAYVLFYELTPSSRS